MLKSKLLLAVAGLIVGFLFSNAIHRPRVDLNMDGAPPVSVPGYSGPIYDAKGTLVGYAQPRVVNLTPVASTPNSRASKPERQSVARNSAPHTVALPTMTLR